MAGYLGKWAVGYGPQFCMLLETYMETVLGGVSGNPPAKAGDIMRPGFDFWVGKIPWRRAQQPTPVFFLGEPHGERSLAGCSPWGHTESDTTEAT